METPEVLEKSTPTHVPGSLAVSKELETGVASLDSTPSTPPSSEEATPVETGSSSKLRTWLTLIAITLEIILGGLDFSIVGVAVPAITQNFHTIADVGWYSVSYRLTACVSQFAWGQLYNVIPVRRGLLVASVIFLAGSAMSAAATSSAMFVAGRAITGIGSAGVLIGEFAALMVVAPLRIRPMLISLLGALEATAMVAGPIIGGLLTQNASWRWCFYINLPVGGLSILFLAIFLKDVPPPGSEDTQLTWKQLLHKLDLVSSVLLGGCLTSLFLALSWAGVDYAWSSGTIIGLLVTFAISLGLFAFAQYKRGDDATLPPRILKQRSVLAGAFFSCWLNGALNVLEYYIPIYFQVVQRWSPDRAGYMMLPITIGFNIGLLVQGFCTSWVGYYTPFMILSSVLTPIGAGLITTWSSTSSLAPLIIFTGILGLGAGLAFETPQVAVQTVLSEADSALGLSITLFAQNFGGAVFISIAQQIFTSQLLENLNGKVADLTPASIQSLGLVDLPQSLTNGTASGVLDGLETSFIHTWYMPVTLASLMIVCSLAMEWKSVKTETSKDST